MVGHHHSTFRGRPRPRLDAGAYVEVGAKCSVTIATRDRRLVFGDPGIARATVEVLQERSAATGVPVYGYCLMPDHVHLVLAPSPTCDITKFVGQIKNLAQRAAWQRGVQGRIWQESFWDHFLRSDEVVGRVVEYVLNNPVRKGLVSTWREYEFAGSLVFDL